MKILIIGSEGFIGSNLFGYFSTNGHEVWGADIYRKKSPDERYITFSAKNPAFNDLFVGQVYDLCINCSGSSTVSDSLADPGRDFHLNTINVYRMLESIKNYQPDCRFINLSSAAIYGDPHSLPIREEFNARPVSPYGYHKHHAEQICDEFNALYGIPTCTLRIFSVYGPGLRKQILWDLFMKAQNDENIILFGTGNESRDFIYVDDLAKAIYLIAVNSTFKAEIFNVANGVEILIKDVVEIFYSLFDREIKYSFNGHTRKGDPVNWKADITKLKSIGYEPSIAINIGLKNYYDWVHTQVDQEQKKEYKEKSALQR